MGRYIPPALRKPQSESTETAQTDENALPSRALADLSLQPDSSNNVLLTPHDIHTHFWPNKPYDPSSRSTLNDSEAEPGRIAYVCLFSGANPRWSEGILFAKSHLELLPAVESVIVEAVSTVAEQVNGAEQKVVAEEEANKDVQLDAIGISNDELQGAEVKGKAKENVNPASTSADDALKEAIYNSRNSVDSHEAQQRASSASATVQKSIVAQHDPVAIFQQIRRGPRTLKFIGWHKIAQLERLQPKSPELVRMLEQKWSVTDRFGNVKPRQREGRGWEESLKHEWAVIKMEKCDGPEVRVEHVERDDLDRDGRLIVPKTEDGGAGGRDF